MLSSNFEKLIFAGFTFSKADTYCFFFFKHLMHVVSAFSLKKKLILALSRFKKKDLLFLILEKIIIAVSFFKNLYLLFLPLLKR